MGDWMNRLQPLSEQFYNTWFLVIASGYNKPSTDKTMGCNFHRQLPLALAITALLRSIQSFIR